MQKGNIIGEFPIGNQIREYHTKTSSTILYSCKDIAFVSGLEIYTIHTALTKAHEKDETLFIKKYENVYYCSHRGIDALMDQLTDQKNIHAFAQWCLTQGE